MQVKRPKRLGGIAFLVILLMGFATSIGSQTVAVEKGNGEKPVKVGLSKQLIVDYYAIAKTFSVSRRLGEVAK